MSTAFIRKDGRLFSDGGTNSHPSNEHINGMQHKEVAVILNNLASVCLATGRRAEAEDLYLQALSIKERVLAASHPEVGMTLNNVAVFYKTDKQYDKVEAYYQRALSIFKKGLGPEHPKVALTRENYAKLLRRMGRAEEARSPINRATGRS